MFEKNTKQVNDIIVKIFAVSTIIIAVLVVCSYLGVFEFGRKYMMVILIAGLVIMISPAFLLRFFLSHYALGFTIEYAMVSTILYFLVKRAKRMMEERDSAEEENRLKSHFLSGVLFEKKP